MINTLNIGKYINNTILSDKELSSVLGTRIYPLIADNNVKFPFVVYTRSSLVTSNVKDCYYEDDVSFEITVVADTYSKSVFVANKIRQIFESRCVEYDEMQINDTKLISASEEYNDAYIQKLLFNSKIQEI